jgi:hypothetical protein
MQSLRSEGSATTLGGIVVQQTRYIAVYRGPRDTLIKKKKKIVKKIEITILLLVKQWTNSSPGFVSDFKSNINFEGHK